MRIKQEIDLERLHANRLAAIEASSGPIVAIPAHYPAGYHVKPHHHTRAQLLYARTGVVMVTSVVGRWMVPPEHALWIPPDIQHSVEMLAGVNMLSIYVQPGAVPDLPGEIRVVALDDLTRALIVEAVAGWAPEDEEDVTYPVIGVFRLLRGQIARVTAGAIFFQLEFACPWQLRVFS